MNISTTCEYSSGCESGWTMYLDQVSNSTDDVTRYEGDDEGLSMVSDASSGPPHHCHENSNFGVYSQYNCYTPPDENNKKNKSNKTKTKETNKKQQKINFNLDDTASSPIFYFSQDNVPPSDSSQVLSTSHFEDESMTKKNLGFLKSSTKGKSGSWLGKKRQ